MKRLLSLLLSILTCCLLICAVPLTASAVADVEPNDSAGTAQNITSGDTVSGNIFKKDVDFYKMTLPRDGRMTLDMTSYMQYYTLQILDSSGKELWYKQDKQWDSDVGVRSDSYNVHLLAGTYYIRVTGYQYRNPEDYWGTIGSSTGTYELVCTFTSANGTEAEPNNSIAQADSISSGTTLNGQIAINDSWDVHAISLPHAGRATLDMTSYMKYYSLCVFDAKGNKVWYSDTNEWDASVGFRNDVHTVDLLPGTYYVKVCGYAYHNPDDYWGTVGSSTGNYSLKFAFSSSGSDETESNDSIAAANPVSSGVKVRGHIAVNDRYDFYKIAATAENKIRLDFTSQMLYYSLYLYDANGNQVWYDEYNELDQYASTRTDTYQLAYPAGTYYLKVTGYKYGTSGKSTGNYQFVVNYTVRPPATVKAANVAASGKPKISWTAVEGAVKYQVYRSNSKNGTYSYLSTTTKCSLTNASAVSGKLYYYKVKSVDNNGEVSGFSNAVSRTCDLPNPVVKTSNVADTGKVRLTWAKIEGAKSYKIYRSTAQNGKYTLMKTVTGTTYTNANAKAGTKYYYKVIAVHENSNANSAYSAVVSRMADLARPVITVKRNNAGKPRISWEKVEGAVKYEVYRSSNAKNGPYSRIATTQNLYLVNKNAKAGVTYYYKVIAVHSNTNANSAYSAVKSVKAK